MAGQKPSKLYETNSIGSSSSSGAKIGRKDLVIVESVNAAKYPDEDDRVRITPMENLVEDYFNQNIEKMYVQQWLGSPVGSFTYNEDGTLKSAIAVYGDGSAGTVDNIIYNLDGMLESAVFTVNGKTVNVTITYAQDLVSSIEYETVGGYTPPVEVPIVLSSTFVPFTAKVGETPDESWTNTGIQKVEVSSPITGSLNISFDSANFEASADKTVWTPTLSGIDLSILANRTFYVRVKTTATLETQTVMTLNGSGVGERTIALVPHIGDGTETYPYPIAIPVQLDNVRDALKSHYKQYSDVSLLKWDASHTNHDGRGWRPIGDTENKFTGSYDGGGKNITNLFVNSSIAHVGLFGTTEDATLKNIKIVAGYVEATNSQGTAAMVVGSPVGSEVLNCNVTGVVRSTSSAGGVSGSGGPSALAAYTTIEGCSFSGDVYGVLAAGGIAPQSPNNCSIKRCSSEGTVTATGASGSAGGIAGAAFARVENCYSHAAISAVDKAGGLIGVVSGDAARIINCYSTGTVRHARELGGLIGICSTPRGGSCYWDTEASGVSRSAGAAVGVVAGKTTEKMKQKDTFIDWDFDKVWNIAENESYPYFLEG